MVGISSAVQPSIKITEAVKKREVIDGGCWSRGGDENEEEELRRV